MMAELIPWLQLARALAWGLVLLVNLPALGRLMRGEVQHGDTTRSLLFFIAASEIYFSTHWLIFPAPFSEMEGLRNWGGALVLSTACALWAAWMPWATDKARGR